MPGALGEESGASSHLQESTNTFREPTAAENHPTAT